MAITNSQDDCGQIVLHQLMSIKQTDPMRTKLVTAINGDLSEMCDVIKPARSGRMTKDYRIQVTRKGNFKLVESDEMLTIRITVEAVPAKTGWINDVYSSVDVVDSPLERELGIKSSVRLYGAKVGLLEGWNLPFEVSETTKRRVGFDLKSHLDAAVAQLIETRARWLSD